MWLDFTARNRAAVKAPQVRSAYGVFPRGLQGLWYRKVTGEDRQR